jgi:hypothetical protein
VSATALLAELEAADIHVNRDGDNLRVHAEPGVSLAPHLDHIASHKPALLKELLQRRIIEALDVEPAHFDRAECDGLWRLWHAHDAKEQSTQ